MEVILLEKVEKLGEFGDIVRVKDGYGRNFLLPQNKALRATNENRKQFEQQKATLEKANKEQQATADINAKSIEGKFFILTRQAGEDGRLYGSVSTRDVANELSSDAIKLDRNQIVLEKPIKYLGVTVVKVKLHAEVVVNVHINVARSKAEAKDQEHLFLHPEEAEDAENNEPAEATVDTKADKKAKAEVDADKDAKDF